MCACLACLQLRSAQNRWGVVSRGFVQLGFICLKKVPLTFYKVLPFNILFCNKRSCILESLRHESICHRLSAIHVTMQIHTSVSHTKLFLPCFNKASGFGEVSLISRTSFLGTETLDNLESVEKKKSKYFKGKLTIQYKATTKIALHFLNIHKMHMKCILTILQCQPGTVLVD